MQMEDVILGRCCESSRSTGLPTVMTKRGRGSNSSIPDLLKKSEKQRPGSAYSSSHLVRPPSGRRNRPHSAKEKIMAADSSVSRGISVHGAKFDPANRPPVGIAPHVVSGWVGIHYDEQYSQVQTDFQPLSPPPAPKTSPVPDRSGTPLVDCELDRNTDEKHEHSPPPIVPRPPEHISFTLPTVDNYDEDDLLDTNRLLQNIQDKKEPSDAHSHFIMNKPGVTFSEDHNTTVNITPRNLGRKVKQARKTEVFHDTLCGEAINKTSEDIGGTAKGIAKLNNKNRKDHKSESGGDGKNSTCRSQTTNNVDPSIPSDRKKTAGTPVTIVTVSYGDEECEVDISKNKITKKRKKRQEVTTLIQGISLSDSEDDTPTCDSIVHAVCQAGNHGDTNLIENLKSVTPVSMKSEPVKNYYEISRTQSVQEAHEPVVIKSTKTLEFSEDCPKETIVRSVIDTVATRSLGSVSSKPPPRSVSKKLLRRPQPSSQSGSKTKSVLGEPGDTGNDVTEKTQHLSENRTAQKLMGDLEGNRQELSRYSDNRLHQTPGTVANEREVGQHSMETETLRDVSSPIEEESVMLVASGEFGGVEGKGPLNLGPMTPDHMKSSYRSSQTTSGVHKTSVFKMRSVSASSQQQSLQKSDTESSHRSNTAEPPLEKSDPSRRQVSYKFNAFQQDLSNKCSGSRLPSSRAPDKSEERHRQSSIDEDEIISSLVQLAASRTTSVDPSRQTHTTAVRTEPTNNQIGEKKVIPEMSDSVNSQPKGDNSSVSEKSVIQNLINEALSVSSIKGGIGANLKKKPSRPYSAGIVRAPSSRVNAGRRPFSANCPPTSAQHRCKVERRSALQKGLCNFDKHYASYSRSSQPRRSVKPTKTVQKEPVQIWTKVKEELETKEQIESRALHARLADQGLEISPETLERALYPPSGRSKYYEITAELPKSHSYGLLSHPKLWLPDEYKELRVAERNLTRANEIMYRQEVAERRARLAELTGVKKKKKGKKGKTKLKRSKSAK
ncbi:hypothetical protein ScPMuIL_011256 [Solemya velum]